MTIQKADIEIDSTLSLLEAPVFEIVRAIVDEYNKWLQQRLLLLNEKASTLVTTRIDTLLLRTFGHVHHRQILLWTFIRGDGIYRLSNNLFHSITKILQNSTPGADAPASKIASIMEVILPVDLCEVRHALAAGKPMKTGSDRKYGLNDPTFLTTETDIYGTTHLVVHPIIHPRLPGHISGCFTYPAHLQHETTIEEKLTSITPQVVSLLSEGDLLGPAICNWKSADSPFSGRTAITRTAVESAQESIMFQVSVLMQQCRSGPYGQKQAQEILTKIYIACQKIVDLPVLKSASLNLNDTTIPLHTRTLQTLKNFESHLRFKNIT